MFETDEEFDFETDLVPFLPQNPKLNTNKRVAPPGNFETKKLKISEINLQNLPKNVIKRKFPGPAGVLFDDNNSNIQFDKNHPDNDFCSQASFSGFQGGSWSVMTDDFGELTNKYDIKWIETRAGSSKLINQKAPFLAAIIQSIECVEGNGSNVKVTLKDLSGAIQGSIVHDLYEEHSENLTLGSVIVLRQFGVLTTGCNNKHYLMITPNNLVAIYKNCEKDENSVKKIDLRTMNFNEFPAEDATNCNNSQLDGAAISRICNNSRLEGPQVSRSWNSRLEGGAVSGSYKNSPVDGVKTVDSNSVGDSVGCNLDDDLGIPDNFEEIALKEHKKFRFKGKNLDKGKESEDDVIVSCSQVSVKTISEHSGIWQDALDGVDVDSFFEDF